MPYIAIPNLPDASGKNNRLLMFLVNGLLNPLLFDSNNKGEFEIFSIEIQDRASHFSFECVLPYCLRSTKYSKKSSQQPLSSLSLIVGDGLAVWII
ncbi:MAG: hypothetical protein ACK5NK_03610 [Niabella sp.]